MLIKNLHDASLEIGTALPAAGANVTSDCFDFLGSGKADVSNVLVPERVELQLTIPALPNSTSTSDSVTATVMDSDDAVTFTAIPDLAVQTIAGVASTGSAQLGPKNFRLPPTTRRYVAVKYAATAGAGNNTAVKATIALVY